MPSTKCPTCAFLVPENAERCPQCGRVFGEVNRCPSCHAIAAVTPSGRGYRCAACGKPRVLKPGMTMLGGRPESDRTPYRALSWASLLVTVLAYMALAIVLGATAWLPPLVALIGVVISVGFLRAAAMSNRQTAHRLASRREAAKKLLLQGALTKEDLAEKLGIGNTEADEILTSLAADDTSGVRADVDETAGVLRFSSLPTAPAVRVIDPDASPSTDEAALGEAEDEARAAAAKRQAR